VAHELGHLLLGDPDHCIATTEKCAIASAAVIRVDAVLTPRQNEYAEVTMAAKMPSMKAIYQRLREAGASARAVSRRFAMARRGSARFAGGSVDSVGCVAPAVDRRLPEQ
jgi:hypothetical protein